MWGRERELALIESFLGSLDHGPALLVFEGEPGIGKTALWQGATTLAESRVKTVLVSRPAEPEAKFAHSALGDLLAEIGDGEFRSLPGPQRYSSDRLRRRRCCSRSTTGSGWTRLRHAS